ncbi:MAG TPA: DUF1801 domain-containing protein, partial [Actinomycetota bacterium]|nr:DUF1801 domain-containing protein [Actinomycetota bacterium]
EYIAAVDDKRRSDIAALDALIRKPAPELEPVIVGGMLGYGPFHYRYGSGREGDACKLSIASNASYISLYCFAADAKGYVAERYVDRLPKASIGKSCARFKKLARLDLVRISAGQLSQKLLTDSSEKRVRVSADLVVVSRRD